MRRRAGQRADFGSRHNALTVGATIPVNGATVAFCRDRRSTSLGKEHPPDPLRIDHMRELQTAAIYCGTLDIVDLNTMQDPYFNNPAIEIAIPDGYHDRMDMSVNGQFFIGSDGCTNIGNVNKAPREKCAAAWRFSTPRTTGRHSSRQWRRHWPAKFHLARCRICRRRGQPARLLHRRNDQLYVPERLDRIRNHHVIPATLMM